MAPVAISRVFISDDIASVCPSALRAAGVEVVQATKLSEAELCARLAEGFQGLVVRSGTKVTKAVLEAGAKGGLKIVGRAGTGVDNIDVPAAQALGVAVVNTPAGNSNSAAELTCAMILSLARHVPQAAQTMKEGKWERKAFMGTELAGKTLAVVGLGRIGRMVAERMQAFGMRTIGYDPFVTPAQAAAFNVEGMELADLWPQADYITLHVPLIPQTKDLINAEVLGKCKAGVRLVNVARGGILDEAAVAAGLDSGAVGGAAVDVYLDEPPTLPAHRLLAEHPKVVATPHLGASTKEAQVRVAEEVAQQIIDFAANGTASGLLPPTKPQDPNNNPQK